MKYKERDELVADLRELADFLEAKGHKLPIEMWYAFSLSTHLYGDDSKDQMIRAAKNLGSAQKKAETDFTFKLTKPMKNGRVELAFSTSRDKVCTKKVVGTKTKPKMVYVEIPGETVEEEIVEWECTPLLK